MILLRIDSSRASSNKSSSSWRRFNSSSLARDQHLAGVALWSSPLRWFFFFVSNDCSSSFPSILLFQQFFTFSDVTVHQLKLKLTVLDVSQEWAGSCLGLVQLKSTPRSSQFSRLFFYFSLITLKFWHVLQVPTSAQSYAEKDHLVYSSYRWHVLHHFFFCRTLLTAGSPLLFLMRPHNSKCE